MPVFLTSVDLYFAGKCRDFVFLLYDKLSVFRYSSSYSLLVEDSTDPWKRAVSATSSFTGAIIAYVG